MARERLSIEYGGQVLSGRIDVRDLAPSLLALSDLMNVAQGVLYPNDPRVAIEIVATRDRSFIADVEVVQAVLNHVWDLLSGDDATAASNLATLTTSVVTLVGFLVYRAGRAIGKRTPVQPSHTRVTFEDGASVEVSNDLLQLHDNLSVRRTVRELVSPLDGNKVDEIQLRHREEFVTIATDDRAALEPPADESELLTEISREAVVRIASVAFTEGNKWRLTENGRTFYATVEDEAFLDRMRRAQERFAYGDILHVKLLTREMDSTASGRHFEHVVTEVLLHLPAPGSDGDLTLPGL